MCHFIFDYNSWIGFLDQCIYFCTIEDSNKYSRKRVMKYLTRPNCVSRLPGKTKEKTTTA